MNRKRTVRTVDTHHMNQIGLVKRFSQIDFQEVVSTVSYGPFTTPHTVSLHTSYSDLTLRKCSRICEHITTNYAGSFCGIENAWPICAIVVVPCVPNTKLNLPPA